MHRASVSLRRSSCLCCFARSGRRSLEMEPTPSSSKRSPLHYMQLLLHLPAEQAGMMSKVDVPPAKLMAASRGMPRIFFSLVAFQEYLFVITTPCP